MDEKLKLIDTIEEKMNEFAKISADHTEVVDFLISVVIGTATIYQKPWEIIEQTVGALYEYTRPVAFNQFKHDLEPTIPESLEQSTWHYQLPRD